MPAGRLALVATVVAVAAAAGAVPRFVARTPGDLGTLPICGDASVAEALRRAKLQFNVPTLSQAAALAAFQDQPYLDKLLDAVSAERANLATGLARLGLRVWPSAANFVSCVLPGPATLAMAALEKDGILVRDWRDPEHLNELRIGVGMPDDTHAVLAALERYLGDAA